MTIVEALDNDESDIRVVCGDRWLVLHGERFMVYERKRRARNTKEITETDNEHDAVRALLDE